MGKDAEQRRNICRVGLAHHFIEGGFITGFEELLHPGRGIAQTVRREIDGERFSLPVGLSRQLIVFGTVV